MPKNHSAMLEAIERVTGLTVHTYTTSHSLSRTLVFHVNDEWIFRFPKDPSWREKIQKQVSFLPDFAKVSPLPVPELRYVTEQFVGYRKIPGSPLYRSQIERLRKADRQRIAGQLGSFLATLHQYRDDRLELPYAGTLPARDGIDPSIAWAFAEYLTASECRKLEARYQAIADNPANFVPHTCILHADLHYGNILWDRSRKVVTGIIDWAEMGRGMPAIDFIQLADFNTSRNDEFLRDVVRAYGGGDGLFRQVKEMAIIEVENWMWFSLQEKDQMWLARTVRRLKRILSEEVPLDRAHTDRV